MEPMGETWYTKTLNHEVDSTITSIVISISIAVMIESFLIVMTVLPRSTDEYSFELSSWVERLSIACHLIHLSLVNCILCIRAALGALWLWLFVRTISIFSL